MPSAFEPCGLTQMIAMRYGTVPVVHDTGGLHDTVKSYPKKGATGFVFKNFNVLTFFSTLKQAKKIFDNKPAWQRLQLQGMKQDFSWKRSAREYVKLYKIYGNLNSNQMPNMWLRQARICKRRKRKRPFAIRRRS